MTSNLSGILSLIRRYIYTQMGGFLGSNPFGLQHVTNLLFLIQGYHIAKYDGPAFREAIEVQARCLGLVIRPIRYEDWSFSPWPVLEPSVKEAVQIVTERFLRCRPEYLETAIYSAPFILDSLSDPGFASPLHSIPVDLTQLALFWRENPHYFTKEAVDWYEAISRPQRKF